VPSQSSRPRRFTAELAALEGAWLSRVTVPRRHAAIGGFALIAVAALLWARHGTMRARIVAGACLLVPMIVALVYRRLEARARSTPKGLIRSVVSKVDAERAGRALRALTLLQIDGAPVATVMAGTSQELAELHVSRAVAALPADKVAIAGQALGRRLGIVALVFGVTAAGILALDPWRVLEGLDVLAAVHGVAPLQMVWFDDLEVTARPPDYLHAQVTQAPAYSEFAAPRGTLLTVSGTPAHAGRAVALSDGTSEVPFVDDGKGHVVARWPLGDSVDLRAIVRFGDVVIREPETTRVQSIADEPPVVTLEGAPRKILLAKAENDDGTIPIRYEAEDDHGLREVHLVLRSGVDEERRVLARLDGETRFDRGGYVLRSSDAFIKKNHAPVEVTVEAKDNDPITGPKWGASASIVLVPPDVGEPQAARLDALRKLRDAYVDALASRIAHDVPKTAVEQTVFLSEEEKSEIRLGLRVEETLATTYAGIRIPGRLQAMIRGQSRKVREAMNKEGQKPSAASHKILVGATERFVLVIDAIVRGLGRKDTRRASRELADVADDLALGAAQMQRPSDRSRGDLRMQASTLVLGGGSHSLVRLGTLGRDLGEIVATDLSRVGRAKGEDDLVHAEIAAQDLAARLREPDPSFGARGRSGGHAGGESGGQPGAGGEGDDDEAERAFGEAAGELDGIASDHATEMNKVEQDLREGTDAEDLKELSEEAKKHAAAVRDSVTGLPKVSAGSDSWTSKASAARDNAEAMARALEQGNAADAVSAGHAALDAMDEAKRTAQREKWGGLFTPTDPDTDRSDASRRVDDARKKLEPEVKWAEDQIARLRKKATERKAGNFTQDGEEESKIAKRAGELARKGGDDALPEEAIDALEEARRIGQEAADALKRSDVDRGMERQKEAQHQLEMAQEALGGESEEPGSNGSSGERGNSRDHVDIPKADATKGPEQWRKRVLNGLSQAAGGREKDAVRRYAEGLLR
jgi:hypothetical protein